MPLPRRAAHFDLLRLPGVRQLVRWRFARLVIQLPLLALAALAVYDGLTGSPLAGLNVATVSVWVEYRGLVALVLAVLGNLFCAACPLMLTRGPSRVLRRWLPDLRWPRRLRNKGLPLGLTVVFLYSYEAFALWSSPWLTAWLILGYFLAALLTDSLFPVGTFCRYLCPLGNFNFVLSGVSPTLVQARDPSVCQRCAGKNCLNGRDSAATGPHADPVNFSGLEPLPMLKDAATMRREGREEGRAGGKAVVGTRFPGCETRLYVPAIRSSQDCTLCLNCVRACPHDNVALVLRSPVQEAVTGRPRLDLALFQTVLAWAGLLNAFAMTPSFFLLARWLSDQLHTRTEPVLLGLILLGGLGLGTGLSLLAARLGRSSLRSTAPLFLPLTMAMWGGHFLYHFLLGAPTLWPAVVHALARLGLALPPPGLPTIPRADQAFWLQSMLCELALGATLWAILRRRQLGEGGEGRLRAAPLVLQALLYAAMALWVFAQPMQARAGLLT